MGCLGLVVDIGIDWLAASNGEAPSWVSIAIAALMAVGSWKFFGDFVRAFRNRGSH